MYETENELVQLFSEEDEVTNYIIMKILSCRFVRFKKFLIIYLFIYCYENV